MMSRWTPPLLPGLAVIGLAFDAQYKRLVSLRDDWEVTILRD